MEVESTSGTRTYNWMMATRYFELRSTVEPFLAEPQADEAILLDERSDDSGGGVGKAKAKRRRIVAKRPAMNKRAAARGSRD